MGRQTNLNLLVSLGLVLCCTAVSWGAAELWSERPNDDVISRHFIAHKKHLNHLREMIEEDGGRVSYIGSDTVTTKGAALGSEREKAYLKVLHDIGAVNVTQHAGEMVVWFWVDAASVVSRSRSKGVAFFPNINNHRYQLVSALDDAESKEQDGVYVRSLEGGWFIIYMQST